MTLFFRGVRKCLCQSLLHYYFNFSSINCNLRCIFFLYMKIATSHPFFVFLFLTFRFLPCTYILLFTLIVIYCARICLLELQLCNFQFEVYIYIHSHAHECLPAIDFFMNVCQIKSIFNHGILQCNEKLRALSTLFFLMSPTVYCCQFSFLFLSESLSFFSLLLFNFQFFKIELHNIGTILMQYLSLFSFFFSLTLNSLPFF